MSTLVDFQPSTTAPFSFGLTLNGASYVATITWNIFGQRYYLNLTDPNGVLILCRPLTASGPQLAAALNWANETAAVMTSANHSIPIGSLAAVRIYGTGTAFDGMAQVLSTGPQSLSYPLASNPNQPGAVSGTISFDLNLVDGAVLSDGVTPVGGWLLFHYESLQFEDSG